jgi:hypothetical protein
MLDFAGLCGTMLDHAGPFAGHEGHDWPMAHDPTVARFKNVGSFVEIGGRRPPLPLLPGLRCTLTMSRVKAGSSEKVEMRVPGFL